MMFAKLLAHPEVQEVVELRNKFGFMAYHGGGLEHLTDVIAQHAAQRSGASYYGVHQPRGLKWHVPSHEVSPKFSNSLKNFIDHVDVVISLDTGQHTSSRHYPTTRSATISRPSLLICVVCTTTTPLICLGSEECRLNCPLVFAVLVAFGKIGKATV